MRQHDAGKHNSYTASRRPLSLLHVEEFESRYEALVMERKLKGWSKAKKLAYIAGDLEHNRQAGQGKTPPSTRIMMRFDFACFASYAQRERMIDYRHDHV